MKRPGCAQVAHKSQRVGPRVNLSERAAHELDGRIHCTTAIHVEAASDRPAAAKGVDACGPRRGRGRPTRQRRRSGGWRRTRPQTEPAESEERDRPTGPASHRLQSLERARATRVADPAPPAPATPWRQPLAATGRPARERGQRARVARGSRSRRRPWPRGRPASPASRRSYAARRSRRRSPRRWSP